MDIQKIKKFVQDPDWIIIEELLRNYIEPLKDIEKIDLSDTATNVKAEIKVRKQVYHNLDLFLKELGMFKKDAIQNTPNYE